MLDRMLGRIDATAAAVKDGFPHYGDPATGRWMTSPGGDWTGGFWNGMCWLAGHVTGGARYRTGGLAWAQRLPPRASSGTLFPGFLFYYRALLGARLLGDARAGEIARPRARGWGP